MKKIYNLALLVLLVFLLSGCSSNSSSTNNIDSNTPKQLNSIPKTKEKEKFIPVPGDEILLKYDKETEEKIYIADSLQNYNVLVKSYEIKDNESRQELILNGNVIAVENGTKARVLELAESNGSEKVRILEGKYYNFVGYVPYIFMKELPSNKSE